MKTVSGEIFEGERALYRAEGLTLRSCTFQNGESPLKHSSGITAESTVFDWKYPIWYSRDITVINCEFSTNARAGIWYSGNIRVAGSRLDAPKLFRRCSGVSITDSRFTDAKETLWDCSDVRLRSVHVRGDYFGMNCRNVEAEDLTIDGNYAFDGAENVQLSDSKLICKDAFWNCKNVEVSRSFISGEYLGWNSEDLTFTDCTIESLQGLCFVKNLVLRNCRLPGTTLAFELSSVDADIIGRVPGIKNPARGRIRAGSIGELILDPAEVDVFATKVTTSERRTVFP